MKLLPPSALGKRRRIHAIDGTIRYFTVVDEVTHEQIPVENGTRKVIHLQKIQFEDSGRVEYRFTYYMLGMKAGAKGRWVFGQYSLLIPPRDLKVIIRKARAKRWEGF